MGEPIKPVASNWRKTAAGHESVPLYDVDPNEAASRIAELEAENARLRGEIEGWKETAHALTRQGGPGHG